MSAAGRIKYSDLVDIPKLEALMASFSQVIGIANAVIDVDGFVIVHAGWQDACTGFHRVNAETCRRCVESDTSLVESMTQGAPYAIYRCLNGLVDTASPIVVGGEHVANVFTGQFLTALPDLDFFRRQAQQFGFDEASYLDAISRVPILPQERVEAVTRLYAQLAGTLADNGLDRLRQRRAVEELASLNAELEGRIAARTEALAKANEDLAGRETVLKQILDASSVAIFLVDRDGRITQANQRMAEMFGRSVGELVGGEYAELVHPSEREIGRQKMHDLLADAIPSVDLERRYLRVDHTEFWGHLTGRRFSDASGENCGLVGVIADITERKRAEDALRENKELLQLFIEHAPAALAMFDREMRYLAVSRRWITDYHLGDHNITGHSYYEIFPGIVERWKDAHRRGLAGETIKCDEDYFERRDGTVQWIRWEVLPWRSGEGDVGGIIIFSEDISSFKEHERQLEYIAHYDALTTLPNRVLLADRLHQAMAQAQRRGQRLAVVYLDLDGFKAVNDSYGHEAGDQLLVAVSARMKEARREGDTLARLGGDEFVAVLLDLADFEAGVPMLNRLLAAAAQPVEVGDFALQVSASLGVTFFPQPEEVDADQLLRQADQAMYHAKLAGKNRYHVFDAEQDRSVRGHHESLEHIRRALNENEFVLHYQPKVNMHTGAVIGAEALIRWQHPEMGLLPPAVFLPVIEDHPLAVEIGEWVIDTALTQMEKWHAAGLDIPVSVNVGARQLQQANFAERLHALLAAHPDIMPSCLELEVLETSALEDLAQVSRVINACGEIGVRFALDDFGTGYSSLTYLKRLPVTLLKIDQSFVRGMLDDPDDLAILEGVLGMSNAFRRQVIAEGVETVEHGAMLLQLGCALAQGYGIARPMPAEEMPAWSASWRSDSAWVDLLAVSRDDLPLLYASVEHRAWVADVAAFLKGEREAPPQQDCQHCRFGMWLHGDGQARHGSQPAFRAIEPMHRQVHELAKELCELKELGQCPTSLARLGELHELRDAMLEKLHALVLENRRQTGGASAS